MTADGIPENLLQFLVAPLAPPTLRQGGLPGGTPKPGDDRVQRLLELATELPGVLPESTVLAAFFHVMPNTLKLSRSPMGRARRRALEAGILKAAEWQAGMVFRSGISIFEEAARHEDWTREGQGWVAVFSTAGERRDAVESPRFVVADVRATPSSHAEEQFAEGDWVDVEMPGPGPEVRAEPPWPAPELPTAPELTKLLGPSRAQAYLRGVAPFLRFGDFVVVAPRLHEHADHPLRLGGGGMVFVLGKRGQDREVLERLYLIAHRLSFSTSETHSVAHMATTETKFEVVDTITHTTSNALRALSSQDVLGLIFKNPRASPEMNFRLVDEAGERCPDVEDILAAHLLDVPRVIDSVLGSVRLARLGLHGGVVPTSYLAAAPFTLHDIVHAAAGMVNALALTRGGQGVRIRDEGMPRVTFPTGYLDADMLRAVAYELLLNASRHGRAGARSAGDRPAVHVDVTVQVGDRPGRVCVTFSNDVSHPPASYEFDSGCARLKTAAGDRPRRSYLMHMSALLGSIGKTAGDLGIASRPADGGGVRRYQTVLNLGPIISAGSGEEAREVWPECCP